MEITCIFCSKKFELESLHIARKEACPYCYADIHSCKACIFYDTTAYNDCREPMAERITEKTKANFCDFYKINLDENKNNNQKDDILSAAEALFKK